MSILDLARTEADLHSRSVEGQLARAVLAMHEALTLIADYGHEMDDYEMPAKDARRIARSVLEEKLGN